MAAILAGMQQANIQVPELPDELPKIITAEDAVTLVEFAVSRNVYEARYLQERLDDILSLLAGLDEALPLLSRHHVISHGDLDHKNVLWDDAGQPLLIDWASAMCLIAVDDASEFMRDMNRDFVASQLPQYAEMFRLLV